MSTMTAELPERLLAVAETAARLMANNGRSGFCGERRSHYPYGKQLLVHASAVIRLIRERVEAESGGSKTVRQCAAEKFRGARNIGPARIYLVVCSPSRPDGVVSVVQSRDVRYVLHGSRWSGEGLMLNRFDG